MEIINKIAKYLCLAFVFLLTAPLAAQKEEPTVTRLLFIYDASNSMNGRWQSGVKMNIARNLLNTALDSLEDVENLQLALRVYGHQHPIATGQNCEDTKLEVSFDYNNVPKIKSTLKRVKARGTTPIGLTLEKSAADFPPCKNCRNIIVLITDGIEECNGDPCAISMKLQEKGIILKPFIIGVGLDMNFKKTFECMGTFYDAADENSFREALRVVISQALNTTTTQVNLIDAFNYPSETNVNMTFYEHFNKAVKYNIMHTLDAKGNPDTLTIEPLKVYDIVAHTLPPVRKDSITIIPGIHNIIGLNTPQGALIVKPFGAIKDPIKVIVRQKDSTNTLHLQDIYEKVKFITGKYDIEILTTPRVHVKNIDISQSKTTTVEFPTPGLATIMRPNPSHADIFEVGKNGLEWVYKLDERTLNQSIKLQPGNYLVVNRPLNARSANFTVQKSFTVKSGASVQVKVY